MEKYVYSFGPGGTDGDASMRNLLGGKGANLAEMARLGLPVPAGFTITTEFCSVYFREGGEFPDALKAEVARALKQTEEAMGMKYGDAANPLLLSSRSGARRSMPGMMETVLNVGLCSRTIPGLVKKSGNERFVYDAYRRLITMYSDVVMEKAEGIEPEEGCGVRVQLEKIMDELKESKGYKADTDLTAEDLKRLCEAYKAKVKQVLGRPFPDDPQEQLWGAVGAVFKSWNGKRAVSYRKIEGIPHDWGTACNVQSMVFGNMGKSSATGVAFTRNPATGENKFFGEWLVNAQGEDVVAGIRTPNPLNEETKSAQNRHLSSLQAEWPKLYRQLDDIRTALEKHYTDMQDIEFTIQEGKLYMLQCRGGKRTGTAALNMAMDMLDEGLIDEQTAVMRVAPEQLDELLHPIVDPEAEKGVEPVVSGLPAGPGGACGQIVFTSAEAVAQAKAGKAVILVREETNPEDVEGMRAAQGILTARGGMTSHAALVARGWGKCCIVGAGAMKIDLKSRTMSADGRTFKQGDLLTLNGTRGLVYGGKLNMIDATENPRLQRFMDVVDKHRTLHVRANADNPDDARIAVQFGAEGIGLLRTEHMFYGKGSEKPLFALRKMIMADTRNARLEALEELFPYVKDDVKATLKIMDAKPVTIRLLDPPLHEFVPQEEAEIEKLCEATGLTAGEFTARALELHETNPMMGHRGVRLGVTYPEIYEMQARAIFEASADLLKAGLNPKPEIEIPLTGSRAEFVWLRDRIVLVGQDVQAREKVKLEYCIGTMLEVPRACLVADQIACEAEFVSFGTNDLSQLTFGFSRDDAARFMAKYLDEGIIPADPFQRLDTEGVGKLVEFACRRIRDVKPDLPIGICGEHGGDPASIDFFHKLRFENISCSPYRVPVARLAAAQSAAREHQAES